MPASRPLPGGIKVVRVNVAGRGERTDYRFFLKKDDEILADGRSFDERELVEYLEQQREARQHD